MTHARNRLWGRQAAFCGTLAVGLALACLVLVQGGCGLIAKDSRAMSIDLVAAQAALDREGARSGEMTDAEAVTILTRNSVTFADCAATKTVNLLEYLFDARKTLLVSGEYAQRLDEASLLAAETLLRAGAGGMPAGWLQRAVEKESAVLLDVKAAKDGKRSPME